MKNKVELKEILLKEMYDDNYFPNCLVDRIKEALLDLIQDITYAMELRDVVGEEAFKERVQAYLDRAIYGINNIQEEVGDEMFETVAREAIGDSIYHILRFYKIDIDIEEAIRYRAW